MLWYHCWVGHATYGDLEVDKLLGKCTHLVVEAELIVADLLGSEDKVALTLLGSIENDLVARSRHNVVDIKRTTGLDLHQEN